MHMVPPVHGSPVAPPAEDTGPLSRPVVQVFAPGAQTFTPAVPVPTQVNPVGQAQSSVHSDVQKLLVPSVTHTADMQSDGDVHGDPVAPVPVIIIMPASVGVVDPEG